MSLQTVLKKEQGYKFKPFSHQLVIIMSKTVSSIYQYEISFQN
jgi:hypothetical protein